MVWYDVVWYGVVWYAMVWYDMGWDGMGWDGMLWYGMAHRNIGSDVNSSCLVFLFVPSLFSVSCFPYMLVLFSPSHLGRNRCTVTVRQRHATGMVR